MRTEDLFLIPEYLQLANNIDFDRIEVMYDPLKKEYGIYALRANGDYLAFVIKKREVECMGVRKAATVGLRQMVNYLETGDDSTHESY